MPRICSAPGRSPVHIRVGLNSGEVVVRVHRQRLAHGLHRGGPDHASGRPHGAARQAGHRLCSPATRSDWPKATSRSSRSGSVPVKGLAEPVEVYELTGAGACPNPPAGSRAARADPFVGRSAKSRQLNEALAHAAREQRPGRCESWVNRGSESRGCSGSSRTRTALRAGSSSKAGSVSYGKATPYLPVIDLLKALFQDRRERRRTRHPRESHRQASDAWTVRWSRCFCRCSRCSTNPSNDPWQRLDPPQRRRQTLDAFKRLLAARERRLSRWCWCSRTCTGSTPRPRHFSTVLMDSLPTAQTPAALQLSARVSAPLGQSRLTTPTSARSARRRDRPGIAAGTARSGPERRPAQASC